LEGKKFDAGQTRIKLTPGTKVKFSNTTYQGPDYKELSEQSVIHQASAVWTGKRPEHLMQQIHREEYKKKLKTHRKSFMLYLKGEVFLRAALVRVNCEIAEYLSDTMGIAEHKDENDKKINIFFHTEEVKVFSKNIRKYGKHAKPILPVGCLCSVDAKKVHTSGIKNVEYQAISILAGNWPLTHHPTLLPGGQGSVAPTYKLPSGTFTFYYMELALEAKLQKKVNQLKEILTKPKGQIQYEWKTARYIQSNEQFNNWNQTMEEKRNHPQKKELVPTVHQASGKGTQEEDERTNHYNNLLPVSKEPILMEPNFLFDIDPNLWQCSTKSTLPQCEVYPACSSKRSPKSCFLKKEPLRSNNISYTNFRIQSSQLLEGASLDLGNNNLGSPVAPQLADLLVLWTILYAVLYGARVGKLANNK
jgi:hypothetical protein